MPDSAGNFKGMSVSADAWERVFGKPHCDKCREEDQHASEGDCGAENCCGKCGGKDDS